jgi:hypothetical protein
MAKKNNYYNSIEDKFSQFKIPKNISTDLKLLIQDSFESFENIYQKKIPDLLKVNNKKISEFIIKLYSLKIEYEHIEWHIKESKRSFRDVDKFLNKIRNSQKRDKPILDRNKIIKKINDKLNKKITTKQLIKWANNHIEDRYKEGSIKLIEEVMLDLSMWNKLNLELSNRDLENMISRLLKKS